MFVSVLLFAIGLVLVVVGADYFIAGSSLLARRAGIPKLIIGLTFVALGTSAPELGISIFSSFQGHNDLTLGNILGSNIANILLIFGGSLLFSKAVHIKQSTLTQIALATLTALALILLSFGKAEPPLVISQAKGLILTLAGIIYWFYLYRITKDNPERLEEENISDNQLSGVSSSALVFLITVTSLAGLLIGSQFVVSQAITVATWLHIPELIIGGTIVAVGTSLPELATSIQAVRHKQYDLMVGNIVGSNIVNTLYVLGVSAALKPITISNEAELYLRIAFFASVFLLIGFTFPKRQTFERWGGAILVALYFAFLIFVVL